MWNRRRDIDDWRMWCGRNQHKATLFQLNTDWFDWYPVQPVNVLPSYASFEDTLVEQMDARDAIKKLPQRQAAMLALRTKGYSSMEVAKMCGCSRSNVDSMVWQARQKMKARCAVQRL
jgi:DNA-directed RNA polymerase specialized sigma24 family protein